jgi:hypothetical protein
VPLAHTAIQSLRWLAASISQVRDYGPHERRLVRAIESTCGELCAVEQSTERTPPRAHC